MPAGRRAEEGTVPGAERKQGTTVRHINCFHDNYHEQEEPLTYGTHRVSVAIVQRLNCVEALLPGGVPYGKFYLRHLPSALTQARLDDVVTGKVQTHGSCTRAFNQFSAPPARQAQCVCC